MSDGKRYKQECPESSRGKVFVTFNWMKLLLGE